MKRLCGLIVLFLSVGAAMGQDEPRPEQFEKMYKDALVQLKSAQERKNELAMEKDRLARENEKLAAKVAELQKQVDAVSERIFTLRSQYAAFQEFLKRFPALKTRWRTFIEHDFLSIPQDVPPFIDPDWPLSTPQ